MSAYKGPNGQEDMPYLLTAGPVTTSRSVKIAMLADYDADDDEFIAVTRFIRSELPRMAGGVETHDCVLLQGSGTYAQEAALAAFCPERRKKTLVICNGSDGEHAASTLERMGRALVRLTYRETTMPRASDVAKVLDEDRSISHVWLAHVETSSGMLNPFRDIAQVVHARGRVMMLDATSSFGGILLNVVEDHVSVLVSTVEACLESVPGISFILARPELLEASVGQSHGNAHALTAEWFNQKSTDQFRHTPPTHTIIALQEALRELAVEGGVMRRSQRYLRNAETVRERMKALGFTLLLSDVEASPIIQSILAPRAATYDFKRFHDALRQKGFSIAAGKLAQRASFRVGNIGGVNEKIMQQLVAAIEDVMHAMDVRSFAPGDQ